MDVNEIENAFFTDRNRKWTVLKIHAFNPEIFGSFFKAALVPALV